MQLVQTQSTAPERPELELSVIPPAPAGDRARQLMQEARAAALDHLEALKASIGQTITLSQNLVLAGDLYGVGLQDLARRLTDELEWRAKTLEALIERQREASSPRPTFRRAVS